MSLKHDWCVKYNEYCSLIQLCIGYLQEVFVPISQAAFQLPNPNYSISSIIKDLIFCRRYLLLITLDLRVCVCVFMCGFMCVVVWVFVCVCVCVCVCVFVYSRRACT